MAATHTTPSSSSEPSAPPLLRAELETLLRAVRARTELLVGTLTAEQAAAQHSELMSPVVWDLGHIAAFESLWLQEQLEGEIAFPEMPGLYDPFEHPRRTRGSLPLPSLDAALAELRRIRERTLALLTEARFDGRSPLLRDGYVYRMVAQHESQHQETILQALQLRRDPAYSPRARVPTPVARSSPAPDAVVRFPGGEVLMGTDDRAAAYDNERPAHTVRLEPFEIDVTPVTNGSYLRFIDAGGYDRRELWSEEGWAWRDALDLPAPGGWMRRDGEWHERTMDVIAPLDPLRPVCHVSWHEAEAYARYVGKRLPSEPEWEAAATWDPAIGRRRAFPWGDSPPTAALANIDQLGFGTAQVGAYPGSVSPAGCHGMIGDVWEWTSSNFRGYPGFEAFPYAEYSEAFFGAEYRVLRGGSWATAGHVARATFPNRDYPIRRQIFSGFRCARDA